MIYGIKHDYLKIVLVVIPIYWYTTTYNKIYFCNLLIIYSYCSILSINRTFNKRLLFINLGYSRKKKLPLE